VCCGVGAIMVGARAAIVVYAAAAIILYAAAGCIICGGSAAILLVGARAFWERGYASSVGLGSQSGGYSVAAAYR
jgi:hypothetical protein